MRSSSPTKGDMNIWAKTSRFFAQHSTAPPAPVAFKGFTPAQVCKAPEVVVVDYPSRGNGSYVSSVMAYGSKELSLDILRAIEYPKKWLTFWSRWFQFCR